MHREGGVCDGGVCDGELDRQQVGGRRRTAKESRALPLHLLLIAGLVAGCTTTPRAVLWIPFTYTAENRPTLDYPSGSTCHRRRRLPRRSLQAVRIETPGSARLDWDGGSWATPAPDGHVVVTPVLQPGLRRRFTIGPIYLPRLLARARDGQQGLILV